MTGRDPFTVAIDGPAAAGKGTLSRRVAERFGFAHLDTGLLYRAVARKVLDGAEALQAAQDLTEADVTRDDLRTPEVSQEASRVAADGAVREALVAWQRAFARRPGGAVLDGRDIGTVICPDADVKLYVTARDTIRAERRFLELQDKGHDTSLEQVLADQRARDARDSARTDAPMRMADDAVRIDTSDMTIDQAVARAFAAVEERMGDKAQ